LNNMSGTNYIASNWRVPENSNSSKNDNYSLSFDGSSDVLTWGQTDLPAAHTISFWVKMGGLSTDYRTILIDTTYAPGTAPVRRIYLRSGRITYIDVFSTGSRTLDTTNDVGAILTDGDWHHVVVVRNDTVGTIYIDNVNKTNDAAIGSLTTPFYLTRTGESITSYGSIFIGDLSDISFFDYALDSLQVDDLYGDANSGAGNPMALKPTPVAYYPLGDNSSGGIDVGPTSILTQPNASVDDASVFYMNPLGIEVSSKLGFQDGTNAFSGAAWVNIGAGVNATTMSRQRGRLSNGTYPGWHFGTTGSGGAQGDPEFEIRGNDPSQGWLRVKCLSHTLQDDLWHFIAFTYDGSLDASGVKLYVDGYEDTLRQVLVNTFTGTTTDYNTPFVVGGGYHNNSNTRFGSNQNMSNAMYFESELSAPDILTLYNDGIPLNDLTSFTSLKARWKLDQSANWEADTAGNWQIPDAVSAYPKSFSFNGTNQYVPIGTTSLGITSAITVSAWVKTTDILASYKVIACEDTSTSGQRNWLLVLNSSRKVQFIVWHTNGTFTSITRVFLDEINDGNWHHILATYDGTANADGIKLYIDGNLESATAGSTGINSTASVEPYIGSLTNGNAWWWNGNLSNIAVWDSVQNIDDIYNSGTPAISYTNTPTAWWKLDDTATFSTNWSIPDASGNGNDGTSSGMTEQSLVNNNVSALNGESSGMTSGNLVLSDLTRNLPYENYSLDFDSASPDYIGASPTSISSTITVSVWIKTSTTGIQTIVNEDQAGGAGTRNWNLLLEPGNKIQVVIVNTDGTVNNKLRSTALEVQDGNWHQIVFTYDGTANVDGLKTYVDGGNLESFQTTSTGIITTDTLGVYIGSLQVTGAWPFSGNICNVSIFNEVLTSTEVQKLYANGMPQDLTNFTPQPAHWWTLGKESFWNGDWIVRDMIGSNDGTSANMGVDSLVGDAPRSEANGTGTNMDIPTNLVGNAGFSDKNAYSINMGPTARVTDTP